MKLSKLRAFSGALLAAFALCAAPFARAAESEDACKQVSAIIDMYVAGKADEAELKAMDASESIAKALNYQPDPLSQIMDYLSGNASVDFQKIAVATQKRPEVWALASMALFVRGAARDAQPDPEVLANSLRGYQDSVSANSDCMPCVSKWKDRAPAWIAWCEADFASAPGLEPLFQRKSRSNETLTWTGIDDIKPEDFIKTRTGLEGRPKPAGLAFQPAALEDYFNSIQKDDVKALERQRYDYVKDIKPYLMRIFERSPYTGKVKMKSKQVSGTIALANEKVLVVGDGAGKNVARCEWSDLAPEQFADFLSFYAKLRLQVSGPNLTEAQKRRQAADDLMHACLVCDWYGKYPEALAYAKVIAELAPDMKPQLNKVLLGR